MGARPKSEGMVTVYSALPETALCLYLLLGYCYSQSSFHAHNDPGLDSKVYGHATN